MTGVYLFAGGAALLAAIIGLFWLKDRLQSPTLARLAYSGLVARLAVVGAVLCVMGILVALADLARLVFA